MALLVDDAQWMDERSVGLCAHVAAMAPDSAALLVLVVRLLVRGAPPLALRPPQPPLRYLVLQPPAVILLTGGLLPQSVNRLLSRGPGRYCSPHQWTPFNSRNEASKCAG